MHFVSADKFSSEAMVGGTEPIYSASLDRVADHKIMTFNNCRGICKLPTVLFLFLSSLGTIRELKFVKCIMLHQDKCGDFMAIMAALMLWAIFIHTVSTLMTQASTSSQHGKTNTSNCISKTTSIQEPHTIRMRL